jgi:RHH-type transcriptional regulator, proline utilization regulon repressor / proline dehydrogenase / delta 1-pyrroline-5-carboxylate dehydrogenase
VDGGSSEFRPFTLRSRVSSAEPTSPPPAFEAPYAEDDVALARELLTGASLSPEREARIDERARRLIAAIRAQAHGFGNIEALLREYSLSSREGVALMALAESLLRIPDAATADRLIEEKLAEADFAHHIARSESWLAAAASWTLGVAARIVQPGERPEEIVGQLARRLGMPAIRAATRHAVRLLGGHFVFAQTIEEALDRARSESGELAGYSFDMLGEGSRTRADAARYFDSYAGAIAAVGRAAGDAAMPNRPGISVKLTALHPRFDPLAAERVLGELTPKLVALARQAKNFDLCLTVDAEEADRLELTLEIFAALLAAPELAGWDGLGIAIQAYQKRARAVIDFIAALAERFDRRLMVRLVKGAYWDAEIKRAQERGLDDYPVFTRKAMTDLNYLGCAERLLAARPRLFPQFATHNALTVAAIVERAGGVEGFEFQRLHGMGDALYRNLAEEFPDAACRRYAPVGRHDELLAYLIRRLLENGANSSFVSEVADPAVPVETLLVRPAARLGSAAAARHPLVPCPPDLFRPARKNSAGIEFGHRRSVEALLAEIDAARGFSRAVPLIAGEPQVGAERQIVSPIDAVTAVGTVIDSDPALADRAMIAAADGFRDWSATPAEHRAAILERAAELIEARRGRLTHLLQVEGGKTLDDCVGEIRETVDFCRYYAAEGRALFGSDRMMPGPTGETNALRLRGRGAFVAISPWNFPLSIFLGQIAAALMAGNAVVAKPAEQTPLIAAEAVALLHEAGVPVGALHLLPGDGAVGARLVEHAQTAGVVFTGSTEVGRSIARALAAKDGPIVPLIAETGGINAMIVDATALAEQVTDDVIASAFRSAGQRCSALRLLCLQDEIADRTLAMIAGAAAELTIGDPRDPAIHVGPVIDAAAKAKLDDYVAGRKAAGQIRFAGAAPRAGVFVAPRIVELAAADELREEVFGPILHVVRYRANALDALLAAIATTGYGLTLGIHSRLDTMAARIAAALPVGNVYVNRNMIGAVVGVQPFGGTGLSGTGPKAGGPHYLPRFATEQTVTANTTAIGNLSLLRLSE